MSEIDTLKQLQRDMPGTAANPDESAYERGKFDGVMAYRRLIDQALRDHAPSRSEPSSAVADTAAWLDFADNGNIRFWTANAQRADDERARGRHLRAFTLAELIALASKAPLAAPPKLLPSGSSPAGTSEACDRCGGETIGPCVEAAPPAPSAASTVEPVAWPKPISTAPNDGTVFIAHQNDDIYKCAWREEEPDEGPPRSGWYDFANRSFEDPTHWQPLEVAAPTTSPEPDAVREALAVLAKYEMVIIADPYGIKPRDFTRCNWVAGFTGSVQPEFRHFQAARDALARNDRGSEAK